MNSRLYLAVVAILFFCVGCSSNDNEAEPNKSHEIAGSWIFSKYTAEVDVSNAEVEKSIIAELLLRHPLDSIIWVFDDNKTGRVEVLKNPLISDNFTYAIVDDLVKITFSKPSTGLPENPGWRDLPYRHFVIEDRQLTFDKDCQKEYKDIYPNLDIAKVMQYTHYKKMTKEDRFFGEWLYVENTSAVKTNRTNTTNLIKEELDVAQEKLQGLTWVFETNSKGKLVQNAIESSFSYSLKTDSDTITIQFNNPVNTLFESKEYGYSIVNNELKIIQSHVEYYKEIFTNTKITTAEETQIYNKTLYGHENETSTNEYRQIRP